MKLSDFKSERKQILAINGKTEDDMAENLLILREWMKKLPHIPSDVLQDDFLEICFIKNKFLMEKTKRKIEEYCTFKAAPKYQYLFEKYPTPSKENIFYVPHPDLTEDFYRVHIGVIREEKEYSHIQDARNFLIMSEVFSHCDYNNGEIIVLDYSRCSASLISKFRLNVVADCTKLVLDGYSARLKQVHFVNKSAKMIVSFLGKLVPAKLASRLIFHEDYESLRKVVPLKYLPSDFGGEWKSYDEILKDWDKIYEKERDLIQGFIDTKVIEELRQKDLYIEEMKGTFKKLGID